MLSAEILQDIDIKYELFIIETQNQNDKKILYLKVKDLILIQCYYKKLRTNLCWSCPLSTSYRKDFSSLVFTSYWRCKVGKSSSFSLFIILKRDKILKSFCIETKPCSISLFSANFWELLLRRESHRKGGFRF